MPVVYENTVSGVGEDILPGGRAAYLGWEVLTQGPRVRNPMESDPDHLNGVGFLSFGNDLSSAGLISGVGWQSEIWLNWLIGQWIVIPTQVGADFGVLFADHVRWSLSVGSSVHFYVFA